MTTKDEKEDKSIECKLSIHDWWVVRVESMEVTNKQEFSDVLPFAATPCLMVVTTTVA